MNDASFSLPDENPVLMGALLIFATVHGIRVKQPNHDRVNTTVRFIKPGRSHKNRECIHSYLYNVQILILGCIFASHCTIVIVEKEKPPLRIFSGLNSLPEILTFFN
ncbi:MAG: hypothetical protein HRF42_07205 [Candidatus Brocadia sp.]|jgi:hypothetical protein